MPIVRYPGGNFLSGYNWRDGVGPREKRPVRLDLAWFSTESNEFGTDEFMKLVPYCGRRAHDGGKYGHGYDFRRRAARRILQSPGGTTSRRCAARTARMRPITSGIGASAYEMDGPWQIGHLSADEYGKKALEAAKVMRWYERRNGRQGGRERKTQAHRVRLFQSRDCPPSPSGTGSSSNTPTARADLLSMHRYYMYSAARKRPLEDFLGSADDMAEYIGTLKATIEYVRAKERSRNAWASPLTNGTSGRSRRPARSRCGSARPTFWRTCTPSRDALVFAGLMNTLLNNCDAVRAACLRSSSTSLRPS